MPFISDTAWINFTRSVIFSVRLNAELVIDLITQKKYKEKAVVLKICNL